jgi:L-lysine exporter family protein LysE/ArgO
MTAFFSGFALALSFIIAIGAQNAFVLRQGIRGEYVLLTVLTCVLSELALVSLGVSGFGALIEAAPWVTEAIKYGGSAFLFIYGAMSFKSALTSTESLNVDGQGAQSWKVVVLTCLAMTWLNPHTYLDTTILIGSLSAQYGDYRWHFGMGAVAGASVFFFALGYGAGLLRGIFEKPAAWRILDAIIGVTMWTIATSLLIYG